MSDGPQQESAVTVVATRVIHPGKNREFAEWADALDRAVAEFDGHLGGARLHDAHGLNHVIYRFDTAEHLAAWHGSSRRRDLVARGDEISDQKRTEAAGTEPWFTVPSGSSAPKWKQFLITWGAAYPTLLLIFLVVSALVPGVPQPITLAISSATLTAVLTWLLLPRLNQLARPWLHRRARPTPMVQTADRDPGGRG